MPHESTVPIEEFECVKCRNTPSAMVDRPRGYHISDVGGESPGEGLGLINLQMLPRQTKRTETGEDVGCVMIGCTGMYP